MTTIYDHKNRPHVLEGCSAGYTYLQCVTTGARIRIANAYFTVVGFTTAPQKG